MVDSEFGTQWSTTNKESYPPLEIMEESLKISKRNFKKKTPFTQWSNAYFGNGVFFNPPSSRI